MSNIKNSNRAVLVSLVNEAEGVRLSLDDIYQSETPILWAKDRHVTSQVYPVEKLEDMNFTEKELADIGHYIVARLRALRKVWGK